MNTEISRYNIRRKSSFAINHLFDETGAYESSLTEFAEKKNSLNTKKTETPLVKSSNGYSPKRTMRELFELYPALYIQDEEIDWGSPVGDEVW